MPHLIAQKMCGGIQNRKLCAIGVSQEVILEVDPFSFEFFGMILHRIDCLHFTIDLSAPLEN